MIVALWDDPVAAGALPHAIQGRPRILRSMDYHVESIAEAWPELRPLAAAHWDEVIAEPGHHVQLDEATFNAGEAAGRVLFIAARAAGVLVGYVVALLVQHPHATGMRVAEVNALYLDPAHRLGTNANGLIVALHEALAARGVDLVYQCAPTTTRDLGPLLRRLGYAPTDILWCRRLRHASKDYEHG